MKRGWLVAAVLLAAAVASPARATAPSNDDFSARQMVTGLPRTEVLDMTAATVEDGEWSACHREMTGSVWYEIAPSELTFIEIARDGGDLDPMIGLYRTEEPVDDVATLTQIFDSTCREGRRASIRMEAEPGFFYYVSVARPVAEPNEFVGSVARITFRPGPRYANDDFLHATSVAALPFHDAPTGEYVTLELDEPTTCTGSDGPREIGVGSRWYSYRPSQNEIVHVDSEHVAVWTGARIDALTNVLCGEGNSFRAVAGTDYHIQIGGFAWRPTVAVGIERWWERSVLSIGEIEIVPDDASVARITGGYRASDPRYYDVTVEVDGGPPVARGMLAPPMFALPPFHIELPPGARLHGVEVFARGNPANRDCLSDGGPGTPCEVYAPHRSGSSDEGMYLMVSASVGELSIERSVRLAGAGHYLGVTS